MLINFDAASACLKLLLLYVRVNKQYSSLKLYIRTTCFDCGEYLYMRKRTNRIRIDNL